MSSAVVIDKMEEEKEEIEYPCLDNINLDEWEDWVLITPKTIFKNGDIFILSTNGIKNNSYENRIYKVDGEVDSNGNFKLCLYNRQRWIKGYGWGVRHLASYARFPNPMNKYGKLSCPSNCKCHKP